MYTDEQKNENLRLLAAWLSNDSPTVEIEQPELLDACLKILPFVEDAAQHGSDDFRMALKTLKKALGV